VYFIKDDLIEPLFSIDDRMFIVVCNQALNRIQFYNERYVIGFLVKCLSSEIEKHANSIR